ERLPQQERVELDAHAKRRQWRLDVITAYEQGGQGQRIAGERAGDGELCTDDVDPGLAAPNRPAPQPHDGRAQIAGVDLQLFQLLAEFLSEPGAAAPATAPARLPWLAFSIDLLAAIGDLRVQQERALQLDCFELAECEIGPAPSRAEAVMHVGKKQD